MRRVLNALTLEQAAIDALQLALRELDEPGHAQRSGRNLKLCLQNALFAFGVESNPERRDKC